MLVSLNDAQRINVHHFSTPRSATKQDTTLGDQVHQEKMAPEPVCKLEVGEKQAVEVNREQAHVTEALITKVSNPDVICDRTADTMEQSTAKLVTASKRPKLGRSDKKINMATKTVLKKASKTTLKRESTGIEVENAESGVFVSKKSVAVKKKKKKAASKGGTKAVNLEERDDECVEGLTDFEEVSQVLGPLPV